MSRSEIHTNDHESANVELQTSLFRFLDPDDIPRLTEHLRRFIAYVSDHKEHTLTEIASVLGMSACSASARWRDVKKLGGLYTKRKDEKVAGLWHYKLTKKPE